jgi:hypothetical protein
MPSIRSLVVTGSPGGGKVADFWTFSLPADASGVLAMPSIRVSLAGSAAGRDKKAGSLGLNFISHLQ